MKIEDTNCTVIIKGGRLLLTKRSGTNFVGWWCFPGGHAEAGETMHQAAQREANEEVGSVKVHMKPFIVFIHKWPTDGHIHEPHKHRCHAYKGKITGRLHAGSDASELGWFTIEQALDMQITGYTRTILGYLQKKGKG